MLLRKVVVTFSAASADGERAETELFGRLEELARGRPFLLDCSVQQIGHEFLAVLSDHYTGHQLCAWAGPADVIAAEFKAWIERRFPMDLGGGAGFRPRAGG
jgi:hypothetical protein